MEAGLYLSRRRHEPVFPPESASGVKPWRPIPGPFAEGADHEAIDAKDTQDTALLPGAADACAPLARRCGPCCGHGGQAGGNVDRPGESGPLRLRAIGRGDVLFNSRRSMQAARRCSLPARRSPLNEHRSLVRGRRSATTPTSLSAPSCSTPRASSTGRRRSRVPGS